MIGTSDRKKFSSYTKPELEEFFELCNFTEEEEQVLRARARKNNNSVVRAAGDLNMSIRTVERHSAEIRRKITHVQHRRRGNSHACEEIAT